MSNAKKRRPGGATLLILISYFIILLIPSSALASLNRCYTGEYDAVGNPTRMTDPEGADGLSYDGIDRLISNTRTAAAQPDAAETYDYNALGALKKNASIALDDQRVKLAGAGTADAAVMNSLGGQPVTLDAGGRVTSLRGVTLTYNKRGRLVSVQRPSGANTEIEKYGYDPYFRRTARQRSLTVAGVSSVEAEEYFVYGGANVDAIVDRGNNVTSSFLYDGVDHPLRLRIPGTTPVTYYYEVDLAGNVRRLRRPDGSDAGGYRYSAFGELYAADAGTPGAAVEQPLRWKGRWYSEFAGGRYDVRARWWSPELGSFLSIDEFAYHDATSTLWGWANQSPTRFADPSGRCPTCLAAELGAVAGGIAYAFTAPTNMSWGDFGWGAAGAAAEGAGLAMLAMKNPQAAFLAISGLSVASDKDLWKLGLLAPLATAGGGASCPGKGTAEVGPADAPPGSVGAMRRNQYVASPKHPTGVSPRPGVSPGPMNGQDALDWSVEIGPNTDRRVGIDYDTGEFAVFDQTQAGEYHGHVRGWDALDQKMQNALIQAGMVNRRGKILGGD